MLLQLLQVRIYHRTKTKFKYTNYFIWNFFRINDGIFLNKSRRFWYALVLFSFVYLWIDLCASFVLLCVCVCVRACLGHSSIDAMIDSNPIEHTRALWASLTLDYSVDAYHCAAICMCVQSWVNIFADCHLYVRHTLISSLLHGQFVHEWQLFNLPAADAAVVCYLCSAPLLFDVFVSRLLFLFYNNNRAYPLSTRFLQYEFVCARFSPHISIFVCLAFRQIVYNMNLWQKSQTGLRRMLCVFWDYTIFYFRLSQLPPLLPISLCVSISFVSIHARSFCALIRPVSLFHWPSKIQKLQLCNYNVANIFPVSFVYSHTRSHCIYLSYSMSRAGREEQIAWIANILFIFDVVIQFFVCLLFFFFFFLLF